MGRLLAHEALSVMVSMIFVACEPRASIQGSPSAVAIGAFLSVVTIDPAVLRSLASTTEAQPTSVSFVCLSARTEAVFSALEQMSSSAREARDLAERLQRSFRAVTLSFPSEVPLNDAGRAPIRVVQADTCTGGGGAPRLWVTVSPTISNPYADRGYRSGFFANVRVESDRRFIVARYSYWIATAENAASAQAVVTQVLRVDSGIDNIVRDRTQLLP